MCAKGPARSPVGSSDPGGKAEIATVHHDSTDKTVMGVTGDLDESDFCNIVHRQPNSAHFVASKLWRKLASDSDPSAPTLGRLRSWTGPQICDQGDPA